jgi:hypothetical protein
MHLRVGAGQKLAVLVVDDELHEQRACGGIDSARCVVECRDICLARTVGEQHIGLQARLHDRGIGLRYGHVQAQAVHVGYPEQRRARILACGDEPADVGVSRSDDSIEGCDHLLEPGQLAQPLHIRVGGLHLGIARIGRCDLLVSLLLRHGVGDTQIAPPLRREVGDLPVGLGRREIRFRLAQLRVDFR